MSEWTCAHCHGRSGMQGHHMAEQWSKKYGGPGICPNSDRAPYTDSNGATLTVGFCCPRDHKCEAPSG